MQFDAFISYSHAADGLLAPALQRGLQRLAKGVFQRRALQVFRDETGLSTNPHLWASIEQSLLDAEWFVLLASPPAAQSEWVNREVATWLEHRPAERILLVMTEGELAFGHHGGIDIERTDCIPPALAEVLHDEPRWLDLRWARQEEQLDLANGRFRAAVADLAAPMHGVAKADLEGEDVRQQRRARRLAVSAGAVLATLAIAASAASVVAIGQSRRANAEANTALARGLASEARAQAGTDIDLALLLAVEAFRREDSIETRSSLLTTLESSRRIDRMVPGLPADLFGILTPDDGSVAWVATNGGTIQAYDPETLTPITGPLVSGVAELSSYVVSPDGQLLAYADKESVHVVDTVSGKETASFGQPGTDVYSFDSTGRRVLVRAGTGSESSIEMVDSTTGASVGARQASREILAPYASATLTSDDRVLATFDGLTVAWFDSSLQPIPDTPAYTAAEPISSLDVNPDGTRALVATNLTKAQLLDAEGMAEVGTPVAVRGSRIVSAAFLTEPGQAVIVGSDDGSAVALSTEDGTTLATLTGLTGPLDHVVADQDRILSYSYANGEAIWWGLGPHAPLGAATDQPAPVWAVQAVGDGSDQFVSLDVTGRVALTAGGEVVAETTLGDGVVGTTALAVDRERGLVAASGAVPDETGRQAKSRHVFLLDLDDLSLVRSAEVPDATVFALAFSPDGTRLAVGTSNGSLLVWDTATLDVVYGPVKVERSEYLVGALLWSSDGSRLFMGGQDGILRAFDTATWDMVHEEPLTGGIFLGRADMAPDGASFVVAAENGEVFTLDSATGEPVGPVLVAGGTQLQAATISGDGSVVAAISRDGTVRLWDRTTGRPLGPALAAHDGFAVTLDSVGQDQLISAGMDQPAVVNWDLDPASWIETACRKVGRNLTEDEWADYVGGPYRATCPGVPS